MLGPHRKRGGWEVCETETETAEGITGARRKLWLRCPDRDTAEELMAGLPCAGRYRVGTSGSLVPLGKKLPVGRVPAGPWVKLMDWLKVEGPQAVLPGRCQGKVEVRLERSGREEPAAGLLMSLEMLTAWAESASRLRMGRLRFAVSGFGNSRGAGTNADDGPRALVLGEPPPSAPGQACYARGRLLLPCGWDFTPPVVAAWVEESLALPPGAVALLDPSGSVEMLEQESFAPLSLAAVRRTCQGLGCRM